MTQKHLQLRPSRAGSVRERTGEGVVYDIAYEDLQLDLVDLPDDLPFGLYRLSIATPDALEGPLAVQLDVDRAGERTSVRVVAEPRPDRMDLYLVLLGDERDAVLTIALEGPNRITLGAAHIERVSTT